MPVCAAFGAAGRHLGLILGRQIAPPARVFAQQLSAAAMIAPWLIRARLDQHFHPVARGPSYCAAARIGMCAWRKRRTSHCSSRCSSLTPASLINPAVFVQDTISNFPLVASIIIALLVGKGVAARFSGRSFGYTTDERLTVWALTLPQVAAPLAAALVAHDTLSHDGHRLLSSLSE